MRSLFVTKHGGPDVLEVRDGPDPQPKPGEVLIAVKRAGLNFADITARVGLYAKAPQPPMVLGYEVAGEILALGEGAAGFKVGDRVFALTMFGGQANRVAAPVSQVSRLPDTLTFDQGAALPVAYLTAVHMLFHVATLRPKDVVLLQMAASGVGLAVLDLCKQVPDVTVIGTASAGKHAFLKAAGLTHAIDYHSQDYVAEVRRLTNGRGVNLAIDSLGGPDWHKAYGLLRKGGQLIALGWANMVPGEKRSLITMVTQFFGMKRYAPFQLMQDNKTVSGLDLGNLWDEPELLRGHLDRLIELAAAGEVKPHVDTVFPLSKGPEAHRHVQDRKNVGKVVFDCDA